MKKKIPKFDMKAWTEKQEKLEKEANGGGSPYSGALNFVPFAPSKIWDSLKKKNQDWLDKQIEDSIIYSSSFPRRGVMPILGSGVGSKAPLLGAPGDKYLFSVDDDTDFRILPQGYVYGID